MLRLEPALKAIRDLGLKSKEVLHYVKDFLRDQHLEGEHTGEEFKPGEIQPEEPLHPKHAHHQPVRQIKLTSKSPSLSW